MEHWDTIARRYVERDTLVDIGWVPDCNNPLDGPPANDNNPYARDRAEDAVSPLRKGDFIQTYTGKQFWPMDPRPGEVDIRDIAHALSMQCRYAGHCLSFYSVAEHSIHVYRYLVAANASPDVRLAGLLHDASEAYLVDVPRPVKPHLKGYYEAEEAVMQAVFEAFGLSGGIPGPVKYADNSILLDERAQNMLPAQYEGGWPDLEPLGIVLEFMSPAEAEAEFLRAFHSVQRLRQEQARRAA
jgi:hypothetical protein